MGRTFFISRGLPEEATQILVNLGKNFALARKKRRLTMEMVAERVQVSRLTISKIEKGNANVSIGAIMGYAYILGLEQDFRHVIDPATDAVGLALDRDRLNV